MAEAREIKGLRAVFDEVYWLCSLFRIIQNRGGLCLKTHNLRKYQIWVDQMVTLTTHKHIFALHEKTLAFDQTNAERAQKTDIKKFWLALERQILCQYISFIKK